MNSVYYCLENLSVKEAIPSGHHRRRNFDVEIFLCFSTLFRRRNFDASLIENARWGRDHLYNLFLSIAYREWNIEMHHCLSSRSGSAEYLVCSIIGFKIYGSSLFLKNHKFVVVISISYHIISYHIISYQTLFQYHIIKQQQKYIKIHEKI